MHYIDTLQDNTEEIVETTESVDDPSNDYTDKQDEDPASEPEDDKAHKKKKKSKKRKQITEEEPDDDGESASEQPKPAADEDNETSDHHNSGKEEEEKETKDKTDQDSEQEQLPDGMYLLTGYVSAMSSSIEEKCLNFIVVVKNLLGVEAISLPLYSLPTTTPWIQYTIIVKKRETGSIFDVVTIRLCEYREITKKDLKNTLLADRAFQTAGDGGSESDSYKEYMKYLTSVMGCLPDVIKSEKEVNQLGSKAYKDRLGEYTPARAKSTRKKIQFLLRFCFRGPIFLSLLRFFDGAMLVRMTKPKIRALYCIVINRPFAFCFWTHLKDILMRIKDDTGNPMFNVELDGFNMPHNYTLLRHGKVYEHMINIAANTSFSNNIPMWPITRLRDAAQLLDVELPATIEVIREALIVYMDLNKNAYMSGNTAFPISDLYTKTKPSSDSLEFLVANGIMKWSLSDRGGHNLITSLQQEDKEISIALNIEKKIHEIHVIRCKYYNGSYVRQMHEWLASTAHHHGALAKHILRLSANHMTASYMSLNVGKFLQIDTNRLKIDYTPNKTLYILIDRFHKVELQWFSRLMKLIAPIVIKDGVVTGGAYLYLVGDMEDYPVHSRRGGGDLMGAFSTAKVRNIKVIDWDGWSNADPLQKIHSIFSESQKIAHDMSLFVPFDEKTFIEHVKSLDRLLKNKSLQYHIFVSTESDKEEVMKLIHKKRPSNETNYEKHLFYVGQKVHILEKDLIGPIEKAWRITGDPEDEQYDIIKGKTVINTLQSRFLLRVCGAQYRSAEYTIEHADVHVIRKFASYPAQGVLFVASTSTTRRDLACATKFATSELKIFMKEGVYTYDIKPDTVARPCNDLRAKLELVNVNNKHE